MKTTIIFYVIFLIIPIASFSQNNSMSKSEYHGRLIYTDSDFNSQSYRPIGVKLNYELVCEQLDTARFFSIIRETISPKNLEKLNKQRWIISVLITGYGKIVSSSFMFSNGSGVDPDEISLLSDRIRNKTFHKFLFNKEVEDLFYLVADINPSPYLPPKGEVRKK